MSSLKPAGYWDRTWVDWVPLLSIGFTRTIRSRCSLSSMIASLTLPSVIWLNAVEVWTWE